MKTLAIVAAALTISLLLAETASARMLGGSTVTTSTTTDAFGNQRTVIRRVQDNGLFRCGKVTQTVSDRFGDSVTRTRRGCRPDF